MVTEDAKEETETDSIALVAFTETEEDLVVVDQREIPTVLTRARVLGRRYEEVTVCQLVEGPQATSEEGLGTVAAQDHGVTLCVLVVLGPGLFPLARDRVPCRIHHTRDTPEAVLVRARLAAEGGVPAVTILGIVAPGLRHRNAALRISSLYFVMHQVLCFSQ